MAPCSPLDVSFDPPDGPSGPKLPGFGIPFALKLPDISPFPDGFPEDLLDLLDKLGLLIPPGALKAPLNPNFGKDVFDAIMKLLDQFMPFLMLYKFFLPILNMIICIIEVLCALTNPFKLVRALKRLFRTCIPEFLNMFPIFALIIMIISLLLLLLALIEYIIAQILKFIRALLRNITALVKAFEDADQGSILAIAKKLGSLLCIFQNLFVLFSIFNTIIQIIKDILSLIFNIPPCDDNDSTDEDQCCTPDVCPAIAKNEYTRITGRLNYLPAAGTNFSGFIGGARSESWQFYDVEQEQAQQFVNIINAFDVILDPKPIFFPQDSTYSAATSPRQAAYTLDLRFFYYPPAFGRTGTARWVRFKNCIMLATPTTSVLDYNNSPFTIGSGVIKLVGGSGYEDDNTTILTGFNSDGTTANSDQATLENFVHKADNITVSPTAPTLTLGETIFITDIEYTFKPNFITLISKNLVTVGCEPSFALNRSFINQTFSGDIGFKAAQLNGIINSVAPNSSFPDPAACQASLAVGLSALRNDLTPSGVAAFQAFANVALQKLKDDTNTALGALIGVGFEACNSDFTVDPAVQFTSKPIVVSVNLKERNSLPLTSGLSSEIAAELASKITGHITFGHISNFTYDGTQSFNADITSDTPGTGQISVSFDNNIFCINNISTDIDIDPTRTLQSTDYQFVYSPAIAVPQTGEGDTDGKPSRDAGDVGGGNSGGGNV